MKMPESMDIRTMDIRELYNLFIAEEEEKGETYQQARFGIDFRFDIYDYFNNAMKIKMKTGFMIYRGRTIQTKELWTELEKRKKVMIKWLEDNMEDTSPIKARGLTE